MGRKALSQDKGFYPQKALSPFCVRKRLSGTEDRSCEPLRPVKAEDLHPEMCIRLRVGSYLKGFLLKEAFSSNRGRFAAFYVKERSFQPERV